MADAPTQASSQETRILLAEDDTVLCKLLEHILRKSGFTVVTAPDGEQALQAIQSRRPDAIIMDAMMPGIDGYELLQMLRRDEVTQDIPVMMLSARAMENDVISGFDFGANDYLTKPFKPEELVSRLKRLLVRAKIRSFDNI